MNADFWQIMGFLALIVGPILFFRMIEQALGG